MTGSRREREGDGDPADTFQQVFGVSKDELARQNIDPDEYALQNIRRALKDPEKVNPFLSPSDQLWRVRISWGRRGFAALFVSIEFLALSHVRPVHWIAIVAAILVFIGALVMYVLMVKYRRQYVSAFGDKEVFTDNRGPVFFPAAGAHYRLPTTHGRKGEVDDNLGQVFHADHRAPPG